jgi:hypothetical protein
MNSINNSNILTLTHKNKLWRKKKKQNFFLKKVIELLVPNIDIVNNLTYYSSNNVGQITNNTDLMTYISNGNGDWQERMFKNYQLSIKLFGK